MPGWDRDTLRGAVNRGRTTQEASSACRTQLGSCRASFPGPAAAARSPLPAPWEQRAALGWAMPRAGCTCVVGDVLEDVFVGHELHLQGAAAAAHPLGPAHGGSPHVGAAPPPGGAAAGGARTGPASPLSPHGAAPAGPGSRPLPAPPAEAAAAGGGSGLTCQPGAVPEAANPGPVP